MTAAIDAFRDAIRGAGLSPPDVIEPGRFIHFPGIGKRNGNKAGWAKFFDDELGGVFGDYSSNLSEGWQAKQEQSRTPAEREAFKRKCAEARVEAEAARMQQQDAAAIEANRIWEAARRRVHKDHPYLARKGVAAHGVRLDDELHMIAGMICGKALLVPMRNSAGELRSIQFIAAEKPAEGSDKRFLPGGEKKGCYHSIGVPSDVIYIVEGYATGASVYEATGHAVAIALDAGNLEHVARALREKYPDMRIVLCADDDYKTQGNPGIAKASEAAHAVSGELAVPDFGNDRPDGATDFNDLAAHRGHEAVKRAIANARVPDTPAVHPETRTAAAADPGLCVLTLSEFLTREFPEREAILAPWLLTQSLSMIHAWRGVGKTHVALGIAYAVATGRRFLTWQAPLPRRVLYIDGEMPAPALKARLTAMVVADDGDFDPENLLILTPDVQDGPMPDLATAQGQAIVQAIAIAKRVELIIVDNISTLCRNAGPENDAESWRAPQEWALQMRRAGRSVLFVHHSGKGGAQRGSSKKEDTLDVVINLKRPADYESNEGAKFEIHFEKYRNGAGDEAKPIEAALTTDNDGRAGWTWRLVEESTYDRVVALANEGLRPNDIAAELGINKSNVSRHMKRGRAVGAITGGKP